MSDRLSPKVHIVGLTSLRGIAALFVVVHHFTIILFPDIYKLIPSKLIAKSYLWVDLFFILSGFVLSHVYIQRFVTGVRSIDYREFMLARFARIYPVHLVVLLAFVVFHVVYILVLSQASNPESIQAAGFGNQRTIDSFLTNVLLLQAVHDGTHWNGPAWSISAEWLVYLIIPFLIPLFQRFTKGMRFLVLAFAFLTLSAIEIGFGDLGMFYAGWPMIVRCLAEASIGVVLYHFYQAGACSRFSGRAVTAVFLIALASLAIPLPHVISVALFALLVLAATQVRHDSRHWLAHRALLYLGLISYSIYMTHWLVQTLVMEPVFWLTGSPPGELLALKEQIFAAAVAVAVVIVISHCCYRYIEMPWRERITGSKPVRNMLGLQ